MREDIGEKRRIIGMMLVWILMLIGFSLVLGKPYPWVPVLDNANVLIHESGHVFLAGGGELIGALGGSIMQLFVPGICIIYFAYKRDFFGSAFGVFWLGESSLNISVYVRDARTRLLPLVGGNTHDWNKILKLLNGLEQDTVLANAFALMGYLLMAVALGWGAYLIFDTLKRRAAKPII